MDVSLSWFQPVQFKINIIIIDLWEWCVCGKWLLMYDTNFLILALMDEIILPKMKSWSKFQLHLSHLHRQSTMKINSTLFSYHKLGINIHLKRDLIKTLRVKWALFHIKSWIYYSMALNVKCTLLFISEHLLLYCLLWNKLNHKWNSCRAIKHLGETHRKIFYCRKEKFLASSFTTYTVFWYQEIPLGRVSPIILPTGY